MIDIRISDYQEMCSCCTKSATIVVEVESIYSQIDFCEECWEEFVKKMKEHTDKKGVKNENKNKYLHTMSKVLEKIRTKRSKL